MFKIFSEYSKIQKIQTFNQIIRVEFYFWTIFGHFGPLLDFETLLKPRKVPDKVPWNKIIETLNYKWKHECQSHGLTSGAMQYLSQKLFRQTLPPSSDKLVSWAQFNREPLANRNFTFWQWFNGVMELTKSKHCQPHWLDKGVVGFIGKAESQVNIQ